MGSGSAGILLLLLATFLLASFVTGRLDWLKRLNSDFSEQRAASGSTPLFGETGRAPTTSGGRAA